MNANETLIRHLLKEKSVYPDTSTHLDDHIILYQAMTLIVEFSENIDDK